MELNENTNMIAKKDLVDGRTYLGFCRNNHVATWDAKKDRFYMIAWQFGPYIDYIEHFEDVKETGYDGFVPLIALERDHLLENKIARKIGYKK
jgi:hypothetical protein